MYSYEILYILIFITLCNMYMNLLELIFVLVLVLDLLHYYLVENLHIFQTWVEKTIGEVG